jgi:hypothetical protein
MEDLLAGIQAAVTAVVAVMLRRVRQNALLRTALCFEMDGGRFGQLL